MGNNGPISGTKNCLTAFAPLRDFASAKKFVQTLGLESSKAFDRWAKFGDRPSDIPVTPEKIYKSEWLSWGDFLGTGTIASKLVSQGFRDFDSAKKFVQALGLSSGTDFRKWAVSGNRPSDIPSGPESVYKSEWLSWGDFLGTGRISSKQTSESFMDFASARSHVQTLRLKGASDFWRWSSSADRHPDIPYHPERRYKEEWIGWRDFLGIT